MLGEGTFNLWNTEENNLKFQRRLTCFKKMLFFPSDQKPIKLFWILHLTFGVLLSETPPAPSPHPKNIPSWEPN